MRKQWWGVVLASLALGGCKCGNGVQQIHPEIQVQPLSLNWGFVALNQGQPLSVKISALTTATVTISGMTLADASPGGAAAFQVVSPPASIAGMTSQDVSILFTPTAVQDYAATLSVASDDPTAPITKVQLFGTGGNPQITLIPDCEASNMCMGTVTLMPPSIDFGQQGLSLSTQPQLSQLPTVAVSNTGNVPLTVTQMAIVGTDATAFSIAEGTGFPDHLPDGGPALILQASTGRSLILRFTPTSASQLTYSAQLSVVSDDPVNSPATVGLQGELLPYKPPVVCANIVNVTPSGGTAEGPFGWTGLVPAPDGGYDFSSSRNIPPRALINFSALSNPTDATTCTTDPQDGRTGLMYQWTILAQPTDSAAVLGQATTPTPTLLATATGSYTLQLAVTDQEGLTTTVPLTFLVAFKKDLVVELSWNQPDGGYPGVDLDVHLIRPSSTDAGDPFSGAFSYFNPPSNTSGDINGKSVFTASQNMTAMPAFNFAWGNGSLADTPSLDVDDQGTGALIENISLDHPEDDPQCASSSCAYKVMVHYFQDNRGSGSVAQCTVGGSCLDGDQCSCADPNDGCVANTADAGVSATGAGLCYVSPQPVIRVFVRSNPVPAAVIPLPSLTPPNPVLLGAPCEVWYAADVVWPSKAWVLDAGAAPDAGYPVQVVVQGADAGRIVAPAYARFGQRSGGSLACSPDLIEGSSQTPNWYGNEPR